MLKTIILTGPGRSGTTLLNKIFSMHSSFGWISGYVNKFPWLPLLSALNRIMNIPLIEKYSRDKTKWPRPAEAYGFWNYYINDFWVKTFEQENEVEEALKQKLNIINVIKKVLFFSNKKVFITKLTGSPKIKLFDSLFENPIYVFIDRDPRAVVMSYYKLNWWQKERPSDYNKLSVNEKLEFYCKMYLENYYNLKINYFKSDNRYIQVYYEDMINDRITFFKKLCNDTNIDFDTRFEKYINSWVFFNDSNEKWKKELDLESINLVNNLLRKPILEMGYLL